MVAGSLVGNLKRAINAALARRGYLLRWVPPAAAAEPDRLLNLGFEHVAAHLMLRVPRPVFLGIGANDGVTHDPLHPFVRDFGWRGAMVEPLPGPFAALSRNYAGFPEVRLLNVAVDRTPGRREIHTVRGGTGPGGDATLHASFSREALLKARQWHSFAESDIETIEVDALPVPALLEAAGIARLDVLKIDTEGHDLEVLRGVDLAAIRPAIVLAEHLHLSRADVVEMGERLLAQGYRIAMGPMDMLAYRAEAAGG